MSCGNIPHYIKYSQKCTLNVGCLFSFYTVDYMPIEKPSSIGRRYRYEYTLGEIRRRPVPIKRVKNKIDVMTSYIVLAADSCFDGNTGNEKYSKTVKRNKNKNKYVNKMITPRSRPAAELQH